MTFYYILTVYGILLYLRMVFYYILTVYMAAMIELNVPCL